ncbi:glycosyltransferase family 39 protein [bacterium]|nr:glycosyltransferase family 39 protein [bacterium]
MKKTKKPTSQLSTKKTGKKTKKKAVLLKPVAKKAVKKTIVKGKVTVKKGITFRTPIKKTKVAGKTKRLSIRRPKAESGLSRWLKEQWQALKNFAQREPESAWFSAVLLAAMILRFIQPDWYIERQFHPDERWIFGVVSQLSYPQAPIGLQYGTFPLYLLALIKDFVLMIATMFGHFDANRFVIAGGRVLSGCFDLVTVFFTYLIGRRLVAGSMGRKVGLLAALFLTFTVLNIQMAHYFVVDVPLGMLVAATLYFSIGIAQTQRRLEYILAGLSIGLAMATKTSAAPLAVGVGIAHLIGMSQVKPGERRRLWQDFGLAIGVSIIAFLAAMPHAILDWDKFWSNQNEQSRILVTGAADVPYNRQYLHTTPYLYYFKNLIQYTMGHFLGLLSILTFIGYPILGLVGVGKFGIKQQWKKALNSIQANAGLWIILSYALVYFCVVGTSFAKFNRYMLPLTPIFCLLAAHALVRLKAKVTMGWPKKAVAVFIVLVVGGTVLWSLAFVSIYQREHPWIAASRWIQEELPAETLENGRRHNTAILNEEWGDDLPTHVQGIHPKRFRLNKFSVQEPDNPRKRQMIIDMLPKNDLIVMADTRAHVVYRRLTERYPINAAYYELMFEEKLGYKLAAEFKNYPGIFGLVFPDDKADESFTLYDHPHVYLFQRQIPTLSIAEITRRLDQRTAKIKARGAQFKKAAPKKALPDKPKLQATPLPTVVNKNIGKTKGRPKFILGKLNGFTAAAAWILLLEIIGLLTIPLCLSLFPRLPDSGVALSKIIGTLILAWTTWFLVSAGIFEHRQSTTLLILVILGGISVYWALKRRTEIEEFIAQRGKLWLSAEIVFLVAFVGYLLTKLYNPDINNPFGQGYNGGGEPMGISFFSAVFYSVHFPPYDPWLSGYSINYYYYGQVILGVLAKLIGVTPKWSYQICISLLFALTLTGVYGLGFGLTGKRRWGIVAAIAAGMLGNLHTFFYILEPMNRGMNWNEIFNSIGRVGADTWQHIGRFEFVWNPTRLIKGTINEMPWFSFLYGDLHAHIIAIPYSLPIIGWGLNVLLPANQKTQLMPEAPGRNGTERGLTFFVTALTLGALSAINTWNFPPYALLILGVLIAKALQERKGRAMPWKALGPAILGWLRLVIGGLLLLFFFHKNFAPQSTSLAFVNPEVRTHISELLQFFALVIFLLSTFWAMHLVPVARNLITRLGWKPKARKPWWDKMLLVIQTGWDKYPLAVYGALTALVGFILLLMFNQFTLAVLSIIMLTAVYVTGWRPLSPQLRLTMIMAVIGLGIVLGCEIVHIRDFMGVGGDMSRMNTVFKFYIVAWIYFALVSAVILAQLFSGKKVEMKLWKQLIAKPHFWQLPAAVLGLLVFWAAGNYQQEMTGIPWLGIFLFISILLVPWAWAWWPKKMELRLLWATVLAGILIIVSLYPPISVYNRMRTCSKFKNPTLNGFAYLKHMLPDEAQALAWIRENIKETAIILEAPGYRGYNCFDTRIAIFTGHPTLIGWIGQEEQMRYNNELTGSHTRDAELIYRTLNIRQAQKVMDRYQVEYVFVGKNEKKKFPGQGIHKFNEFMKTVYDQDGIKIYKRKTK